MSEPNPILPWRYYNSMAPNLQEKHLISNILLYTFNGGAENRLKNHLLQ